MISPILAKDGEVNALLAKDVLRLEFQAVSLGKATQPLFADVMQADPRGLQAAGFDPASCWLLTSEQEERLTRSPLTGHLWGSIIVAATTGAAEQALASIRSAWRRSRLCLSHHVAKLRVDGLRRSGRSVVFTNGVFDLPHLGHLRSLVAARSHGGSLVVGINSDISAQSIRPAGRPLLNQFARGYLVAALRPVDLAVVFSGDQPDELLSLLRPDVLVKGGDYTVETVAGADTVRRYGGTVTVVPYLHGYSTTEILAAAAEQQPEPG